MPTLDNHLAVAKHKLAERQLEQTRLATSIESLEKETTNLREVTAFFNEYIAVMTVEKIEAIEVMVNYGLAFVFGNKVSIKIDKEYKNNKTFFSLNIIKGDLIGQAESFGGGVSALISLIFRIFVVKHYNFYPLVTLDESLSFVSYQYQEKTSMLLREMSEKLGVNILLVSHQVKLNTHAHSIVTLALNSSKGQLEKLEVIEVSHNTDRD
jgi:hypothetical protein